jgi:hypothetical protein
MEEGESGEDLGGGGGWREFSGGWWGSGRGGVEVDVEEWAHAAWTQQRSVRHRQWTWQAVSEAVGEAPTMDQMTVDEATVVGEATVVQAWSRSRSKRVGGREMIVVRVRI